MSTTVADDSAAHQNSERDRLLRALLNGQQRQQRPARPVADKSTSQPVSFGQGRLWFLDKIYGGNAYAIWLTVRINGALDAQALGRSIDFLIDRHDALRTAFEEADGQPMQTVLAPRAEHEPWNAMRIVAGISEGQLDSVIRDFAAEPFELSKGRLLRALLVQTENGSVLALGVHHIAADGWSMGQVQRDLATAYDAFSQGSKPALPDPPASYVDYAVWLRDYMSGAVLEKHLEYWSNQLRDAPDQIDLPFDYPRPQTPAFQGAEVRFDFSAEAAQALHKLANECNATPFMVMLTVFGILLGRHAGQADLVVGTPLAGRDRPEWEPVVGFFANTLALRIDLSGRPSFRDLLARVRSMALSAYAHQAVPFELVVERLAPQREFAYNPLFQVMFAFQPPQETLKLRGVDVEMLPMSNDTAKFDLWLSMSEGAGGYEAVFEYDLALLDRATVEALAGQLTHLLSAAAAAPDVAADELALLSPAQATEVLALGTGPSTPIPAQLVHDQVSARASSTPDAVAVSFRGQALTYAELESAADRLASHLHDLGAGAETLVAVVMPRSLELVIALLAVLKAGAAYVPVDPEYPAERVAYMLADSEAKIVLTVSECSELAGTEDGRPIVLLDEDTWREAPARSAGPVAGTADTADPAGLAYVIYTSGSTGKPKGAMIHHSALANRLAWMSHAYRISAEDRILQKTPYSFDVSVWEFYLPLINGATLVVAPPGAHQDPAELAAIIAQEKVTVAHFVPAMLEVFLGQQDRPDLPSLRLIISSGEALPRQLADKTVRELSVRCENLYGPTEATIDVTAYLLGSARAEARCAATPIGKPIDNVRAHVLGPDLSLQPVGVPGELYLMGAGVGRGYLRRPGLTAERFIPDPLAGDGGYAYRTGDLARLLPDGNIEFLGRVDDQLKIHGFRVEVGEIEAALSEHPGVQSAVVTAAPGTQILVGYVVPEREPASAVADQAVVSQWQHVFDQTYRDTEPAVDHSDHSDQADYAGWRSSYTGENYSEEAMAEWVAGTVSEILALSPRSILEIGCGTGLLVDQLVPHVGKYVATDASAEAVQAVGRRHQDNPVIEVSQRTADDVAGLGVFDAVVLNSVVQYFPDLAYLDRVLTAAVAASAGTVFIGDVRDLRLLRAFHLSVLESRGDQAGTELAERLAAAVDSERELVIDPRYFVSFAERHGLVADVRLKPGAASTEMNVFRYDVRLRRQPTALLRPGQLRALPWQRETTDVTGLVSDGPVVITTIPHPGQAPLIDRLRALDSGSEAEEPVGQAPTAIRRLAQDAGAVCFCVPAQQPGHYDAVIVPGECPGLITDWDPIATDPLTNDPGSYLRDRALAVELRESLTRRLPAYMVPAEITVLAAMPLTPSGKVDRRALAPKATVSDAQYERPQGPVESRLAELVCLLLSVPHIGRHDDFFRVGGESIIALHLVNKARADGILLTPRIVFQHPTVAGMATHAAIEVPGSGTADEPAALAVGAAAAAAAAGQLPDHRPWHGSGKVVDAYPLSPMQHEMLSAALEGPKRGLHTAVLPLSIETPDFDESAFASAWQWLMERHPILRTSFHWEGLLHPVQAVWQIEKPPVTRVDLSGLPPDEQDRVVADALHKERTHVFDLGQAPMWHITLFRLGPGAYRAACRFCYMLQDGWSFETFLREFFVAYDHFKNGTRPELPSVTSFREYISWLMSRDDSDDEAFWTTAMRRFEGRTQVLEAIGSPSELRPRDEVYLAEELELPAEIVDRLGRLTREHTLTLFILIQGAWALTLASVTGDATVTFGVISSGRPEHFTEMSQMVGPFNNMLPAIVGIDHEVSATSWLRRVQAEQVEMREHQYSSLSQIREWGGLEWRTPLYDTYIVFENYPMDHQARSRLFDWEYGNGVTQTEHPIRVMIWPAGGLFIQLSYYSRLFTTARVRGLLDKCEQAITLLADDPSATVGEILRALRAAEHGGTEQG